MEAVMAGLEGAAGVGLLVGAAVVAHQYQPRKSSRALLLPMLAMAMGAAYLLVGVLVRGIPELTGQNARLIGSGGGWLVVEVSGARHTDCRWQENRAWVIDVNGGHHAAGVEYLGDRSSGNRTPGFHIFRPRLLHFDSWLKPTGVRFVSVYRCALWFKEVDSGVMPL